MVRYWAPARWREQACSNSHSQGFSPGFLTFVAGSSQTSMAHQVRPQCPGQPAKRRSRARAWRCRAPPGGGRAAGWPSARPAGRYGRPDNAQNALKAGTCGQIRRNRLLTIHPIKPLPQEFVHACQPPCSLNELQKPKAVAGLATLASVLCK